MREMGLGVLALKLKLTACPLPQEDSHHQLVATRVFILGVVPVPARGVKAPYLK